jgi:hypothetical protein
MAACWASRSQCLREHLCWLLRYRQGPQAGLCDLPFDASTLECFPDENTHDDFPLPGNELPMFCFPRGVTLKVCELQSRSTAPARPVFHRSIESSSL